MKRSLFILILVAGTYFASNAQAPKGFRKGQISLQDGSVQSGYIKEQIRSYASFMFIPEQGTKKQTYNGSQIRMLTVDSMKFICVKGDFFRVISEGRLCLLQKYSDASNKISYNGSEPILISGTDGQRDDYFIYVVNQNRLLLVNKKTYKKVIPEAFAGYPTALAKASKDYDISQIKSDVNNFNSINN